MPVACLSHPWVVLVLSLLLAAIWLRSLSALALRCNGHLTVAWRSRQPFRLERLCYVYALDHAEVSY